MSDKGNPLENEHDETVVLDRTCTVCADELEITSFPDDSYEGGHYFGEMQVPTEDAEIVDERTEELEGVGEITVVEYSEYDSFEYWECDDCYLYADEEPQEADSATEGPPECQSPDCDKKSVSSSAWSYCTEHTREE